MPDLAPTAETVVQTPFSPLFYNAFDAGLNTSYWTTPVSGNGGVAATSVATMTQLGTGTTANGYSTLQSVPTFQPRNPGWLNVTFGINLPFPLLQNVYFFWGCGTQPATPTAAIPLTDAFGFEITLTGQLVAVMYAGGTRNLIATLTSVQPQDANVHSYIIFFRPDRCFWCIDNQSNIVAQTTTGAPGPNINTLPLKLAAIAGSIPPPSSSLLTCQVAHVSDSTSSTNQVSDGTFPWQKWQILSTGEAVVRSNAGTGTGNVQGPNPSGSANTANPEKIAGVFNTTQPTVTNNQVVDAQSTARGALIIASGVDPVNVQGQVASGAANVGNPDKMGGVFNTVQPTVTNGQVIDVQSTARGALIVATGVDPLVVQSVGQAVTLVQQSTTIAAAAAGSVTLPAVATKTTYIRGFTISGAAAAAVVSGLVTITGLTNTFNFYYDALATGQSGIQQYFGEDGVAASAVNTPIVINFPAIVGGSTTAINAWGYQL